MYIITKQFAFEAAHHLTGLRGDHQCARQHGHSYRVEVELQRDDLDARGFVKDYGELDDFAAFLKANLDHRDLNDVFKSDYFVKEFHSEFMNTTAENLAHILFLWCIRKWGMAGVVKVTAVRVSETVKTWAEYRP